MINPLTLLAIASAAKNIFGSVAKKKQADKAQDLEEQKYNDQIQTYMAEQQKAEDERQARVRLITTFAKANGLDSALTPEMMALVEKRREPVAPPPYRKGGTPGFGWDLAGIVADSAASIYGAAKGIEPKGSSKSNFRLLSPSKSLLPQGSFGSAPTFGSSVNFASPFLSNPINLG